MCVCVCVCVCVFASLYFKFQHDKPHTFRVLTFLPLKAILLRKKS